MSCPHPEPKRAESSFKRKTIHSKQREPMALTYRKDRVRLFYRTVTRSIGTLHICRGSISCVSSYKKATFCSASVTQKVGTVTQWRQWKTTTLLWEEGELTPWPSYIGWSACAVTGNHIVGNHITGEVEVIFLGVWQAMSCLPWFLIPDSHPFFLYRLACVLLIF